MALSNIFLKAFIINKEMYYIKISNCWGNSMIMIFRYLV